MKTNTHTIFFRLLALLLTLFSATASFGQNGDWSAYKASRYESGSGTSADPYIIKTAEQLAYLAAQVTSGKDKTACFQLGANIDLGSHYWIPIGNLSTGNGNNFAGTFDGKGYAICNMTVKWEDYSLHY